MIPNYDNFLASQVRNHFTPDELPTELLYGEKYNEEEAQSIIDNLSLNDDNYHLLNGLADLVPFKDWIGIEDNTFQYKHTGLIDSDYLEGLRHLLEGDFYGVTIEPMKGFNKISIELL